jgi:hypothetical protein
MSLTKQIAASIDDTRTGDTGGEQWGTIIKLLTA